MRSVCSVLRAGNLAVHKITIADDSAFYKTAIAHPLGLVWSVACGGCGFAQFITCDDREGCKESMSSDSTRTGYLCMQPRLQC